MNAITKFIDSLLHPEEPQFIDRVRITEKVFKEIKRYVTLNENRGNPETQQRIAWRFGVGRCTIQLIKRSPSYQFYKLNRRRCSKPQLYGKGTAS